MREKRKGLIIVYTGEGKGKTTAALGLAMRAVGHGMRVIIIQFLKGEWPTGERKAAQMLSPWLEIVPMGKGFTWQHETLNGDIAAVSEAWQRCKEAMDSGRYDMVIMDELNYVIHYGFLPVEEVIEALRARPPALHVVLTGRDAHPQLLALADIVTEMRSIKHIFEQGGKAIKGIEF
ncbi:MAG: cob(I)yrinic acid a,c-diamide adenosyltransferase [Anaerolineae bacterium]